jgi:hypothetical protein
LHPEVQTVTLLQALGGIVVALGSFAVGWLVATEKVRLEAFKRRFEIYQEINRLAGKVLHISIKASVEKEQFFEEMLRARLELGEYVLYHGMFLSKNVGKQISVLNEANKEPDLETLRVGYNVLCQTMAKELGLPKIFAVNDALFGTIRRPK